MTRIRRKLASCALAVALLQCALLFAAPVSAHCMPGGMGKVEATPGSPVDCCPAGAHPPGECPLHKTADASTAAAAQCRLLCDAAHAPDFVLGAIGILPQPPAAIAAPADSPLRHLAAATPATRPTLPDPPPPKAL